MELENEGPLVRVSVDPIKLIQHLRHVKKTKMALENEKGPEKIKDFQQEDEETPCAFSASTYPNARINFDYQHTIC